MSKNPTFRSDAHARLAKHFPSEPACFVCADFESRRPLFYKPSLWRRFIRFITRR